MNMSQLIAVGGAPSGLGPWEVFLLFVGIPLGVIALVSAVVVLLDRRGLRRSAPDASSPVASPYAGILPVHERCWVTSDGQGLERHHDESPDRRARRLRSVCWRAECTGCGTAYRETGELVHFEFAVHAMARSRARGWEVHKEWLLCPECARLSQKLAAGAEEERRCGEQDSGGHDRHDGSAGDDAAGRTSSRPPDRSTCSGEPLDSDLDRVTPESE